MSSSKGPLRPCSVPGCSELITGKTAQCKTHQRRSDQLKGSAHERGYGVIWRKIRADHLRQHPFCESCGIFATQVDHRNGNSSDNRAENLRSLCSICHLRRTAKDQPGGAR